MKSRLLGFPVLQDFSWSFPAFLLVGSPSPVCELKGLCNTAYATKEKEVSFQQRTTKGMRIIEQVG